MTRNAAVLAVSFCAVFLCAWIVFIGSKKVPVDRRVSNLAVSDSGRWLAAGTAEGKITVWDQTRPDAPQQIAFPHGSLNDLRFSPDEHVLAIASEDLGTYTLAASTAPQPLRSDRANYGSARFSPDGQDLLVITGPASSKRSTHILERCGSKYAVLRFTATPFSLLTDRKSLTQATGPGYGMHIPDDLSRRWPRNERFLRYVQLRSMPAARPF